jgi:hypothetical protein
MDSEIKQSRQQKITTVMLAIMHGPSVATGLMAHRCPPLLAVFGHELPGYLASSSDMSRLPSRTGATIIAGLTPLRLHEPIPEPH